MVDTVGCFVVVMKKRIQMIKHTRVFSLCILFLDLIALRKNRSEINLLIKLMQSSLSRQ